MARITRSNGSDVPTGTPNPGDRKKNKSNKVTPAGKKGDVSEKEDEIIFLPPTINKGSEKDMADVRCIEEDHYPYTIDEFEAKNGDYNSRIVEDEVDFLFTSEMRINKSDGKVPSKDEIKQVMKQVIKDGNNERALKLIMHLQQSENLFDTEISSKLPKHTICECAKALTDEKIYVLTGIPSETGRVHISKLGILPILWTDNRNKRPEHPSTLEDDNNEAVQIQQHQEVIGEEEEEEEEDIGEEEEKE